MNPCFHKGLLVQSKDGAMSAAVFPMPQFWVRMGRGTHSNRKIWAWTQSTGLCTSESQEDWCSLQGWGESDGKGLLTYLVHSRARAGIAFNNVFSRASWKNCPFTEHSGLTTVVGVHCSLTNGLNSKSLLGMYSCFDTGLGLQLFLKGFVFAYCRKGSH